MALVANHHTAPIGFPRSSAGSIVFQATTILPGHVQEIDNDLWKKYKKTPVIQHYLDKGILTEVKDADATVVVGATRTSDPPIPEHLQDEEQANNVSGQGTVTAKPVRRQGSTVKVE